MVVQQFLVPVLDQLLLVLGAFQLVLKRCLAVLERSLQFRNPILKFLVLVPQGLIFLL